MVELFVLCTIPDTSLNTALVAYRARTPFVFGNRGQNSRKIVIADRQSRHCWPGRWLEVITQHAMIVIKAIFLGLHLLGLQRKRIVMRPPSGTSDVQREVA